MAGCGQCPDQCGCVIVDEAGVQYAGAGNSLDPIVIPRAQNTPWLGTSDNGDLVIIPGDVVDPNDDGHAPDFAVNWCNGLDVASEREFGDILIYNEDEEDCKPEILRDPLFGEFMGLDPGSGKAGWVQGAVVSGGAVPLGVPLEFWGSEASVPANYILCAGQLVPIATYPMLFAVIGHNGNAGVDPGAGNFRIPDRRGNVAAGRDNMGGTPANRLTDPNADIVGGALGLETATISIANLPSHNHTITVNNATTGVTVNNAATGISLVAGGNHTHAGAGANRSFVVVDAPVLAGDYQPVDLGTGTDISIPTEPGSGGFTYTQGNEANTAAAGSHTHAVTDAGHVHGVTDAGHGHTASSALVGSGTGHANVQPTVAANFIMRTS